jgi:hypothetical protein
MAGKTIDIRAPISFAALQEKINEKYSSVLFEHPEGYGPHEVSRLKRREREHIQTATRRVDGTVDVALQNRMAAAYGLVSPRLVDEPDERKRAEKTIEVLLEYPDDYIEPIAEKVWEISNEYRDKNGAKGGDEPSPFTRTSSLNGGSASSSAGRSEKSEA